MFRLLIFRFRPRNLCYLNFFIHYWWFTSNWLYFFVECMNFMLERYFYVFFYLKYSRRLWRFHISCYFTLSFLIGKLFLVSILLTKRIKYKRLFFLDILWSLNCLKHFLCSRETRRKVCSFRVWFQMRRIIMTKKLVWIILKV